jgi:hypothetical protein
MASSSIIAVLLTVSTPHTWLGPMVTGWAGGHPTFGSFPPQPQARMVQRVIGFRSLVVGARQPDWPAVSSGVPGITGGLCVSCRVERRCVATGLCGVSMRRPRQPCGTTCCESRYGRLDRHLNLYETVEAAITGAATV